MTVSTPVPGTVGTSPAGSATVHPVALAARARKRPSPARRLMVRVGTDAVAASVPAGLGLLHLHDASPWLVPGAALTWTASLAASGGYRLAPGAAGRGARPVLRAAVGVLVAAWVAVALVPRLLLDPATAVRSGLLVVGAIALLCLVLDALTARAGRPVPTSVVLVGSGPEVATALDELGRVDPDGVRWEAVAVCLGAGEEPALGGTGAGLVVWPGVEQVADAVRAHQAQAVLVTPGSGLDHAALRRLGVALREEGAALLVGTGLRDVAAARVEPVLIGGLRTLHVRPAPRRGPSRLAKDVADRVGAALLLVAFAPLLVTIALLVRRESPGPAIYRQVRVGRYGRLFTVYKFRTMCAEADRIRSSLAAANEHDGAGVLFKIRDDPRVTRLGARLRTYSLDELPQLVNVLRGEMSLVGPRPPLPAEVERYPAELWERLTVRPGLTGLWQVSGRSDLSWAETVRLDLAYVDNWSWAQDAAIGLRTVGAVLGHRGAY